MKTENQSCCFCFNIASQGNVVDSDILDLLKFLIVNLNSSALENCPVCDSCLNKILETSEYKRRNSSKTLVDMKKEIDFEKSVCHKCEKVCEQGDTFPLIDCVTQIDWSNFVNYLFVDHDSQSLKSLQICGSCQVSISNIQDFLMLIYVHDQSKMKCDIDNSDNIILTENENLVKNKVEIKQEFKNFIVNDKAEFQNKVDDNKAEMICSDSKADGDNTYADFKCLNEEIELKFENGSDDHQSSNRCEKVDVDKDLTSSDSRIKNSCNKEEKEQEMNTYSICSENFTEGRSFYLLKVHKCDKCSYSTTHKTDLTRHLKTHDNIRDFKCTLCPKKFTQRPSVDYHLLKVHKIKDGIISKILECDKCSYETTKKCDLLKHKLKHDVTVGFEKYKCQHCIYETYYKSHLITHIKIHFKCSLCSKSFTERDSLEDHVLKAHKNKDISKIHECDKRS